MQEDKRVQTLRSVARLLAIFAKQVELKRALAVADPQPQLEFWRLMHGGLSNLAVIEWCKLFGAKGSNALHWQRVYSDRECEFRTGLRAATAMNDPAFTVYWRNIKSWRDSNFAHFDPDAELPPKWPNFDTAIAAADYYYSWVNVELAKSEFHLHPATLKTFRQTVRSGYDKAAALAVHSTKDLSQS